MVMTYAALAWTSMSPCQAGDQILSRPAEYLLSPGTRELTQPLRALEDRLLALRSRGDYTAAAAMAESLLAMARTNPACRG